MKEKFNINGYLYKVILKFTFAISIINIISNLFFGYIIDLNIKWLALGISSLYILLNYNTFHKKDQLIFYYFLSIIFLFIPYASIESGGSTNNFLAYYFLILISSPYLFSGNKKNIIFISLIISFLFVLSFEYFFPHLVPNYTIKSQFIDRLSKTPLIFYIAFFIIETCASSYKEINKKLYNYAHFDELTKTYNRRLFNETINNYFSNKKDITLIIIDLDNFKKINDYHGHLIGDDLLKSCANLLKDAFSNEDDHISRWGGDEFSILTNKKINDIHLKMSLIKKSYEKISKVYENDSSLSYGLAKLSEFQSIDEAFKEADLELYSFKKSKKESLAFV